MMAKEDTVRETIRKKIADNNMLGLPAAEIASMVDLILASPTRKEVFDWCNTLLLSEKDAIEIIHLREANRIGNFADSKAAASATAAEVAVPNATPLPSTAPSVDAPAKAAAAAPAAKKDAPLPSLQSLNQKPPKGSGASDGPKVLTVGKGGGLSTVGPLNSAAATAAPVGSGTKKRGANAKALANLSQLGANSLVVGQFFECGCFASTHNFISNCLNCGRIFCEQEMPAKAAAVGSYAARAGGLTTESVMCYACGQDPNRNMAFDIKVQQGLVDQLSADKSQKGFEDAVARRDQLLQFARERSKRTTVVDDQGVGGIAYGTNTAWMTEEEVEQMEERERKQRIADMHKHTGAYRIHLDIVNQSVCFGAIPTAQTTGTDGDASAAAAADGTEDAKAKAAAWAAVPSARPHGAPAADDNAADANAEDDEEEEEVYDEEEEGARRILPLPTLLQKLWYTNDESANAANAAAAARSGSKWDASRVSADGAAPSSLAADGPTVLDLKPTTHRGIIASKRVQNDYFEDDDVAYRVEREDFIFRTKKALMAEEEEAEEAKRSGVPLNKKKTKSAAAATAGPSSAAALTGAAAAVAGPSIDRESFSQHGVGASAAPDVGSSNAIGAAMAAGGRVGDDGMCMSMHQPWASLLVAGIKIHEGRTWPSDFKGRLWIHAAAAKYSENEIEAIEDQHRQFLRNNGTEKEKKFPTNYPTSCLLGYVNVTEVIPKSEYNERIPDPALRQELGDSGYVFMCEKGARMLPFSLPMEGKHKIYRLDRKVWGAARKQFGEE